MWKYTINDLPPDNITVWCRLFPDNGVPGKGSYDIATGHFTLITGNVLTNIYEVIRWKYQ